VATAVITPNQDAVIAEIEIAAPPERVFQALVDSKQAHAWSANEFCELTAWEMDIRPGGACRSVTKEKASGREWAHYGEILKSNLLTCWSTPCLPILNGSDRIFTCDLVDIGEVVRRCFSCLGTSDHGVHSISLQCSVSDRHISL
jgi:hypothetical protein